MSSDNKPIRLGVNIDHVATLRNARGGTHPDPLRAALTLAEEGDADLITLHLREDRRHIRDADVYAVRRECPLPLNLEMAVTEEMLAIALDVKPDWVCFVPERRQEVTTEGGLRVDPKTLKPFVERLSGAGIKVSLFVDPDERTIHQARESGCHAVELHTGPYAHDHGDAEKTRLKTAAALAKSLGLGCHAGHGLDFDNVGYVAGLPEIEELNIGHFLVGEALWMSLPQSVKAMKRLMLISRP